MASADCSSGDTVSPAGLAQSSQILLRISVHRPAHRLLTCGLWEMPRWIHLALAKAGELLQQHFGEMTLAWVGGDGAASLCWEACSVPSFLFFPPSWTDCSRTANLAQRVPSPHPAVLACWHHTVPLQPFWTAAAPISMLSVKISMRAKGKTELRLRYQRVNIFLGLQLYL